MIIIHHFAFSQSEIYSIHYYPNGDSVINAAEKTDTVVMCKGWTGIGRFEDGKKEGWWEYFCNNVPMYSGTYRAGKKEGKWRLEWSGWVHYKNDLLDGEAIYYHVSTFIVEQERHYVAGQAHGDWYVYDKEGKIIETRHYANNQPIGLWEMQEDDLIRKGPVNEFGYHGKWQVTIHDTLIGGGMYINGFQEGDWIDVYYRGHYDAGHYKKGKKQGLWKSYSSYQLFRSSIYVDGNRHGSDTSWTNDNISAIYQWSENEWSGVNVIYFENGLIKERTTLDKNKELLKHTEYHLDGKLAAEGTLKTNPDYLVYQAQYARSCLGIPIEYEFELMERGLCNNSCFLMGHEHPTLALDSVTNYLRSEKFRTDTVGPHRPFGTPPFIRTGTWTYYRDDGSKKEEGKYLPVVLGLTYLENITYPKTGWWKVYDERGKLLREEYYENGNLIETRDRKK